jgi:fucose 4-O-acetylase-like acetyltransferase
VENPISTRDYLIDNVKGSLITLVVLGHFYEPYIMQNNVMKAIFVCIYSFHMPLFVFISGYLSKSDKSSGAYKLLTTILIPYLLFSFLWYLRQSIHTGHWSLDILSPPFHLWYLLSLFIWRLILPFFKMIKYPLLVSIIISLLIGLSSMNNNILSLSRTFGLLPFFLAGAFCEPSKLHAIHNNKYIALFGLVGLLAIIWYLFNNTLQTPPNWSMVFWQLSYHEGQLTYLQGVVFRIILMIIASAMGLSVIVLSSTKKLLFTKLGAQTLTIYIFHGFIVPSFSSRFPIWNQNVITDIIIVIFPFLLVYLLSLPVIERAYNYVINFSLSAILKQHTNSH